MSSQLRSIITSIFFIALLGLGMLSPVERLVRDVLGFVSVVVLPTGENLELVQNAESEDLRQENNQLRKELEAGKQIANQTISATITARSSGIESRRITINKGTQDGLDVGFGITYQGVLVGRIQEVSSTESIVLLTDDPAFRQDVVIGGAIKGVVKGGVNGAFVDRVLPDVLVRKNQIVSTGSISGIVPSGLPIGLTISIIPNENEIFQQVQISSVVDVSEASIVTVVMP